MCYIENQKHCCHFSYVFDPLQIARYKNLDSGELRIVSLVSKSLFKKYYAHAFPQICIKSIDNFILLYNVYTIQKAYYLYLDFLKPFKLSACKIDLCKAFKKVFFLDHRH